MNWQPIETAPKDGTDILLWDGYECITARWKDRSLLRAHGLWQLVQTGDHAESDGVDTPPTHWMPLPEPPQV